MALVTLVNDEACRITFRCAIMLWTNIELVNGCPFLREGVALRLLPG